MLRKFKINGKVIIQAYSKYNAKKKFYAMYPSSIITSIEEVQE